MGLALSNIILETTTCCVCGTRFAVDEIIMNNRRSNAGNIYCPNGHYIGWTETEANRLKKQLAEALQRVGMEASTRRMVEDTLQKERSAARRVNKRIHAGVCPCCNRTFQNLARHMKTKHSEESK